MTRIACLMPLIVAATAVAARADTCTWLGVSGSWCDARNWDCGQVPGADDDVIIPVEAPAMTSEPGIDCDTTINSLTVCAGRTVRFLGPYTLTIDEGTLHVKPAGVVDIDWPFSAVVVQGPDALDIDDATTNIGSTPGRIKVSASGASLELGGESSSGSRIDGELLLLNGSAELKIAADVKVIGSGSIKGSHTNAQISVALGKTLTSTMASPVGGIRGFLKVAGPGALDNRGRIEANGGTIELANSLSSVDDSSGLNRWVAAESGTLKFSVPATALAGDFVDMGVLNIAQNVSTCGRWTFHCDAGVIVGTGRSFKYAEYSGTCPNPGTGQGGCVTPYELDSSGSPYSCTCGR